MRCPYIANAPLTADGELVWAIIGDCMNQVRTVVDPVGMGMARSRVIGLDFGVLMTVAAARHADLELMAEVLPLVDPAICIAWKED